MEVGHLPLNTWIVIDCPAAENAVLTSRHATLSEAEADRDGRNRKGRCLRYRTCMIIEPIAERMGGQPHPRA
jgi:hypothetical protein